MNEARVFIEVLVLGLLVLLVLAFISMERMTEKRFEEYIAKTEVVIEGLEVIAETNNYEIELIKRVLSPMQKAEMEVYYEVDRHKERRKVLQRENN